MNINQEFYTMPFGKFAGEPLDEIPTSYLVWVIEHTSDTVSSALIDSVKMEVFMRLEIQTMQGPGNITQEAIQRIYREMAVKHHPDRGGSNQAMQVINEMYDKLKKL